MTKRILSLVLALVLCLGLAIPALAEDDGASASGDYVYDLDGPDPSTDIFETYDLVIRDYDSKGATDWDRNTTLYLTYDKPSEEWELFRYAHTLPQGTSFTWTGLRPTDEIILFAYTDEDGDGVYDGRLLYADPEAGLSLAPRAEEYGPEIGNYAAINGVTDLENYFVSSIGVQAAETDSGTLTLTCDSDRVYESFGTDTLFIFTIMRNGRGPVFPVFVTGEGPEQPEEPEEPAAPAVTFTDVSADAYYAAPVAWAVEKGITTGTAPDFFSPGQDCSNAQILTFLWRAYGEPEPTIINPFTNDIPDAYKKAAIWAYEKGMVSEKVFDTHQPCTRAMAVTYIWQAAESPAPAASAGFTDVPADAAYAQAVAWAVEKQVTTGTDPAGTMFSPEDICSRGQIVTFLYRALA